MPPACVAVVVLFHVCRPDEGHVRRKHIVKVKKENEEIKKLLCGRKEYSL
jgi:hypothetical protein